MDLHSTRNINCCLLFRQVSEFLRLIKLKSVSATASDTTKVVVCIDLVSELRGIPLELTDLIQVAGVRKTNYISTRRLFENLLNINKVVGVKEICIQLGISEVQSEAEKILKIYQQTAEGDSNDLKHPQYAAMAVYMACKKLKVKASKQKLVPLSRLKPTQWTLLEKRFDKVLEVYEEQKTGTKKKRNKENSVGEEMEVDNQEEIGGTKKKNVNNNRANRDEEEDFEHWKARVLKKAYEDLKRMEEEGIECSSD